MDASALVAMIAREPDGPDLERRLIADAPRLTSGLALWEAAVAIARRTRNDIAALAEIERFCRAVRLGTVTIGADEVTQAIQAHARYGEGTGHPARLNMGDCFAYACARTNGARLLYKGDDFSHTDLGQVT